MSQTTTTWRRTVAGVVGVLSAINGALMVIGPETWFNEIPGVTAPGPFNPHFVLDVGFAFLAAGVGLAMFAWRPAFWSAGFVGSLFLGLHGLLHTTMILRGTTPAVALELTLVVIPSLLAVAATWPSQRLTRPSAQ